MRSWSIFRISTIYSNSDILKAREDRFMYYRHRISPIIGELAFPILLLSIGNSTCLWPTKNLRKQQSWVACLRIMKEIKVLK